MRSILFTSITRLPQAPFHAKPIRLLVKWNGSAAPSCQLAHPCSRVDGAAMVPLGQWWLCLLYTENGRAADNTICQSILLNEPGSWLPLILAGISPHLGKKEGRANLPKAFGMEPSLVADTVAGIMLGLEDSGTNTSFLHLLCPYYPGHLTGWVSSPHGHVLLPPGWSFVLITSQFLSMGKFLQSPPLFVTGH